MTRVQTNFSSINNGFRFRNFFELQLPVKFPLPFGGSVALSNVVFGLCGGMCFAALDYFYLGEVPPAETEVKKIDRKLFGYLCERQLESIKVPVLLKVFEWMLSEDETIATRMARYEIPKLRRMLDRGEPAVLVLVRAHGLDNPTQNHQVLATGYEFDPITRVMRIQLYDPNHPQQEPAITLNLASPRSGLQLAQSTGEMLYGFFVIPYKPQKSVPRIKLEKLLPEAEGLAFSLVETVQSFRLHWPVDSRRINQNFGENPDTYKPFGLPGHEGLDLLALSGANVYAAAGGEVYEAGNRKGHPYGMQVRIKHEFNGKVYHTVYAHLSETFVQSGQRVSAGERIGLADNTGNSFGSHLHLTLKIDGEQTPGYPAGIVDPWPYLKDAIAQPLEPLLGLSGLRVYTTTELNLRSEPGTDSQVLALIPAGEPLNVFGDADSLRQTIGVQGKWLRVQTASGQVGHVAAWFVQDIEQAFPPSELVIYPFDTVHLRSGPSTAFNSLAILTLEDPLTVLGDADIARSKIGRQGEWLQVQTERGERGFVAAWLVHRTGQTAPSSNLVVYPTGLLNVRARPSTDGNIITVVSPEDALTILGDKEGARARVGQTDQWLNVRTPGKFVGYVAAWLVRSPGDALPEPQPDTSDLMVYPIDEINLRAQPTVNAPRIGGAHRNEPLRVVESDLMAAKEKIGKADLWIYAQKKDGTRGWLAAWLLNSTPV